MYKIQINQFTPLFLAAQNGHVPVIKVLLQNGASVNQQDVMGRTALHLAAEKGQSAALCALIDGGADPNKPTSLGKTALHFAAEYSHSTMAKYLIERYNATIDTQDNKGNTPLHYAAITQHEPTIGVLITHGADINKCNNDGKSPLNFLPQVTTTPT